MCLKLLQIFTNAIFALAYGIWTLKKKKIKDIYFWKNHSINKKISFCRLLFFTLVLIFISINMFYKK